jgi:iron(III) transport system permease protein
MIVQQDLDQQEAQAAKPGPLRGLRPQRWSVFRITTLVLALLCCVTVLYPVYRIISSLVYSGGHFSAASFTQFFRTPDIGSAILNTVIVVVVSSAIAIVIGTALAWVNERTDARMGAAGDFLPVVPFLFPAIASAIGWVFLLSPTSGYVNAVIRSLLGDVGVHMTTGPFNIYTLPSLIFVYVLQEVPFTYLMMSAGLRSMDTQLEEQSWMCGVSPRATLRRIVLPALAPSVLGAALLVVWSGFGMFAVPEAIAAPANIPIMSVSIVQYIQSSFPPLYGSAVVMSLIMMLMIAVVWFASRKVSSRARFASVGGRGSRAPRRSLGWWKWPVRGVVVIWAMLGTVLPAVALLLVAMNGYWTVHINWSRLNFAAFNGSVFHDTETALALKDSFMIAAIVATVGVLIAAMLSVANRTRTKTSATLDGLLKLPVIISHLVLALGFILAFAGAPFHLVGTVTLLLLAYLALFTPQATIITDPAALQVSTELKEASELSGARDFRTFGKIFLPLILGSMSVAWGLVFVRVLSDLEVSALLAGPSNPTIGSQTLSLYENGNFSGVAALTLVLTGVTIVVVAAVIGLSHWATRWSSSRSANPLLPG